MPKSSVLLHRINNHQTTTLTDAHISHRRTTRQPTIQTTTTPEDNFDIPDDVVRYHTQPVGPNQCCSAVVQEIQAPVQTVWSVVRRFDAPQVYKHFVRRCDVISGDGDVGTLRRVRVVSGLPAAISDERLEILDDHRCVISFSVVGGDHRLSNYRSVTSLHSAAAGCGGDEEKTIVVESYVVDTPVGNTKEETCVFVDTIVRCNLQSLAQIAENLVRREKGDSQNNNNNSQSA
ncbi:abscisic acid receptor PYL4-like [Silene latifolia]|uniref:abscisic acid receptor PYL4-like n=1 Tax=Silene latifolia TaxID=37657 RepID=UPI003D77E719